MVKSQWEWNPGGERKAPQQQQQKRRGNPGPERPDLGVVGTSHDCQEPYYSGHGTTLSKVAVEIFPLEPPEICRIRRGYHEARDYY